MQTHSINQGDTRTPLGAILKQDGNSIDLTGLSVEFRMFSEESVAVMDWTAATVDDAPNGKVSYDFQSTDVDTAGTFYAWFRIVDGAEYDTLPVGRELRIEINSVS